MSQLNWGLIHTNYKHWENVEKWILIADFSTDPDDVSKWNEKIKTAFRKEGIEARYWSIETLEAKISLHPEIKDVFFDGENRAFVCLNEAYSLLRDDGAFFGGFLQQ